jgi:hypothetical protein
MATNDIKYVEKQFLVTFSIAKKCTLQVTKLVETVQKVVTGTFKKSVIIRDFLVALGWTNRTVHIRNNLIKRPPLVDLVP